MGACPQNFAHQIFTASFTGTICGHIVKFCGHTKTHDLQTHVPESKYILQICGHTLRAHFAGTICRHTNVRIHQQASPTASSKQQAAASRQAASSGMQAGKRYAGEQANRRAGEQASRQASAQASKPVGRQAGRPAGWLCGWLAGRSSCNC